MWYGCQLAGVYDCVLRESTKLTDANVSCLRAVHRVSYFSQAMGSSEQGIRNILCKHEKLFQSPLLWILSRIELLLDWNSENTTTVPANSWLLT